MTTVYLSGPVRLIGLSEARRRFARAARWLSETYGWAVVDPVADEPPVTNLAGLGKVFRKDFAKLVECQAIVLLDQWPLSRGARAELEVAMLCGLDVHRLRGEDRASYTLVDLPHTELFQARWAMRTDVLSMPTDSDLKGSHADD
jgi:hypothetical protein